MKKSKKILRKTKLAYDSLSIPKQIILVGCILGFVSLFLPWITVNDLEKISVNSFNPLSGNIGYIAISSLIFVTFLTLSNSYKEKLKLYSNIDFKNYFLIIVGGILLIILSIVLLGFVSGLDTFSQNVKYGNGIIFCIISGILIIIGGIFLRKDFKENNSEIILEEMAKNREKNKKMKENMELPF